MSASDDFLAQQAISQGINNCKQAIQGLAQQAGQQAGVLAQMPVQYAAVIAQVQADYQATPSDPAVAYAYSMVGKLFAQQQSLLAYAQALQTAIAAVTVPAGI